MANGRRDEGTRALGILLADDMMRKIARSGQYRVRTNRPLFVESPAPFAGKNLRFIDVVDYASDRSITAGVDLDDEAVTFLHCAPGEALLGPEEEDDVITVAVADRRVSAGLLLGDCPQSIVRVDAPPHRSAAIAFGMPRSVPSLVAIVDLARRAVTRIISADSR
jgi:hypothetical protein